MASAVKASGHEIVNKSFFDTLTIRLNNITAEELHEVSVQNGINLRRIDDQTVGVTLDETVTRDDLEKLVSLFSYGNFIDQYKFGGSKPYSKNVPSLADLDITSSSGFSKTLQRTSPFLTHPIFNRYHSETEMLRYITSLQHKDLSLADAMIPLGSCTMKLNATTEMIPVTWPEFGQIHPFVPLDQAKGYEIMHKVIYTHIYTYIDKLVCKRNWNTL